MGGDRVGAEERGRRGSGRGSKWGRDLGVEWDAIADDPLLTATTLCFGRRRRFDPFPSEKPETNPAVKPTDLLKSDFGLKM